MIVPHSVVHIRIQSHMEALQWLHTALHATGIRTFGKQCYWQRFYSNTVLDTDEDGVFLIIFKNIECVPGVIVC